VINPQLAVGLSIDKVDRYPDYTMEPKLDGVRCIVVKDSSGVWMYSRSGKSLEDKLPHLVQAFQEYPSSDFILDGELGYLEPNSTPVPIMDFNATMRVIGSSPDVAISKQISEERHHRRQIHFIGFDILRLNNRDYIANTEHGLRRVILEEFMYNFHPEYPVDYTRMPVNVTWNNEAYNAYVLAGGEGVILKNPVARYAPGKRPANNWYKVKKFESIDVQITGYTAGMGKYEGMIGAITFEYKGREFKCSGMDDNTRVVVSNNKEWYLGRWMEVRHFGFVGTEGLRFPQFLRFREDKDET
jgi:ATP-dependent DNA ligase